MSQGKLLTEPHEGTFTRTGVAGRSGSAARRRNAWLGRLAGIVGGAVVALIVIAVPAAAHAGLASSNPANDARLAAEPQRVVLLYTEDVELSLSSITVVAPDGRHVAEQPIRRDDGKGNTLTASLRPDQAHGTYVLDWRTVASDDGHVTAGSLTFSVGAPTPIAPGPLAGTGGTGSSQSASVPLEIMGWFAFAGFALFAGCAAIRLVCLPPGAQPGRAAWPAAAGWIAALWATLGQLFLYGPYAAGLGPAHLLDRTLLGTTVSSHVGHTLMIRIGLLALVAAAGSRTMRYAASARTRGWALAAASVGVVGLAATWSTTSHAASGGLIPLALPVATAHVTAMGLWAGGLFTLGLCLLGRPPGTGRPALAGDHRGSPPGASTAGDHRGSPPGASTRQPTAGQRGSGEATAPTGRAGEVAVTTMSAVEAEADSLTSLRIAVTRFSTLALTSVITLILTGAYLAWREVGSLGALTGTGYGRLVLLKAGLLIGVIAVASRSRRYVRHRLGDGVAGLRRTVLVELAGVCLLLAITTMLINTGPARTTASGGGTPAAVTSAARSSLSPPPMPIPG